MTETEWPTADDPTAFASFLIEQRTSERKARWFGVACCRLLESWAPEWPVANLIPLLEDIADGLKDESSIPSRVESDWEDDPYRCWSGPPPWAIEDAALRASFTPFPEQVAEAASVDDPESANLQTIRLGLLAVVAQMYFAFRLRTEGTDGWRETLVSWFRDIFGNPFRPISFSPSWRTDTAVAIARQMYESRDFGAMPILADALQDAGCDAEELLRHCRDPEQVHVRGCWAVDLVLGRE